jgi:hypothetical protein|tara:strand:+ start:150 stop:395 length:246 start_codon:yes stop_codon:yes gene_type:complete
MSKTTNTGELFSQEPTEDIVYFQEKLCNANHRVVDAERQVEWLNNSMQYAETQLELHKDTRRAAEKQLALLEDAVAVYRGV